MTFHHSNCLPTLDWNSKVYVCGCAKCDVASRIGVESEVEVPVDLEPDLELEEPNELT